MILQGVDTSNYQGEVDWQQVHRAGYDFGVAKATQGNYYHDTDFASSWLGMRNYLPKRLAYHFFDNHIDGVVQARYMHQFVRRSGGFHKDDAVMLDLETYDDVPPEITVERAKHFIHYILNNVKRQVVLYVGRYYWEYLGNPTDKVFADRPLFVPDYSDTPPTPFGPWSVVSFWQKADNGVVPGISGNVDLDVFFGDITQLHKVLAHP